MNSIRQRLLFWQISALIVTSVLVSAFTYHLAWQAFNRVRDYSMEQIAYSVVRHGVRPQSWIHDRPGLVAPPPAAPAVPPDTAPRAANDLGLFISQIWSPEGELLYASVDGTGPPLQAPGFHDIEWSGEAWRVFTLNDDRTGSLLERSAHHSDQHQTVARQADDLAAILYTSGTTGRSKGAMLTHGNMLSNALTLKDYWGWSATGGPEGRGDVLIHALPIFHVHGLFVAIHGALINGSKMIWMAKFDPKRAIANMAKATVFMGVPTLYVRMLAEPSLTRDAVKNMRLFIAGSAPLLIETFADWQTRTGQTILERYGMSETAMLTSNPYSADARYGNQSERRGGTVGFPLPGVSLRVRGDDGADLPVGEIGGIQVKGPNVFKGYWRMPEKTAEEFTTDGYFKTGDVGKVDERGYVTIVGRSKDLIISGGYNVYPAEIEGYINELPGVAESALVGVPHPDFGEVGVAVVIARPGTEPDPQALINALKARLANYKIPKRCFVVPELPRNTMGKVQKNLLRDQHKGLFA